MSDAIECLCGGEHLSLMGGRGTVEHLRGMHVIRTGMQMGEREREREREERRSFCLLH